MTLSVQEIREFNVHNVQEYSNCADLSYLPIYYTVCGTKHKYELF